MNIQPIKTQRITVNAMSLNELLDKSITDLSEKTIVVITSKIVSLCEGAVIPMEQIDFDSLIMKEADYYLPSQISRYHHHFTIKYNTLIAGAGIDHSNGDGQHVLWPRDPQASADSVREYLCEKFHLENVGVVITDSTCQPLRLGTTGIVMSHSGFAGLNDYVGKSDLFGRPFGVTQSNIAGGLAAAAVVTMGEGSESTPLALISDVPFVSFQPRNPTKEEIANLTISPDEDLFAPFLNAVEWQQGNRN